MNSGGGSDETIYVLPNQMKTVLHLREQSVPNPEEELNRRKESPKKPKKQKVMAQESIQYKINANQSLKILLWGTVGWMHKNRNTWKYAQNYLKDLTLPVRITSCKQQKN